MKPRTRLSLLSTLFVLALGAVFLLRRANGEAQAAAGPAVAEPASAGALAPYRIELLELAARSAGAIPLEPHVKTRSRTQESVVTACLELDQPERALGCVEEIANWRKGVGYADYAFYLAQHGDGDGAARYLTLANRIADEALQAADDEFSEEESQGWRIDRIRAKVAKTYVELGMTEEAAALAARVSPDEQGELEAVRARHSEVEELDERLAALAEAGATADFEQVRRALGAAAELYDRFYVYAERRARILAGIQGAWTRMPALVRIELLATMAEAALTHEDKAEALARVDEAQAHVGSTTWTCDAAIALAARLAPLRFRAGDEARARAELDAALARFVAERALIVDIDRADVLRSLAEAYQGMGDTGPALELYRRAATEGVENPNSRPRAEDLTATCVSMARAGVEPDAELWKRLRQTRDALGAPW